MFDVQSDSMCSDGSLRPSDFHVTRGVSFDVSKLIKASE